MIALSPVHCLGDGGASVADASREERMRLTRVLPAEMHGSIDSIATAHLIGLRFAPDDELEDLVRRVQSGELADRKAVKMAIKHWRADHQRI